MTPPEAIDLAALRVLAEKATPGPWGSSRKDIDSYTADENGELTTVAYVYRKPEARIGVFGAKFRDDSQFIAAADPRTVLALLDRLAAAERVVNECRIVADLDVSNHPLCNSDMRGINEAFRTYDRAIAGQQQRQEGTTDA